MSNQNAGKLPPSSSSPSRPPPLPPPPSQKSPRGINDLSPTRNESIDDLLEDFIVQANKTFTSVSSTDWDLRTTDVELLDPAEVMPAKSNSGPQHFESQRKPEAKGAPLGKPQLQPQDNAKAAASAEKVDQAISAPPEVAAADAKPEAKIDTPVDAKLEALPEARQEAKLEIENPVGASEKPVSRESEMRVIVGAASDSAIALIVSIPAFQFGKK